MPTSAIATLVPSNFVECLGDLNVSDMEQSYTVLDFSRPINLVTPVQDDMDATEVEGTDEMFEVRQVDHEGNYQIVLLSKASVIELMGLMKAWVSIG